MGNEEELPSGDRAADLALRGVPNRASYKIVEPVGDSWVFTGETLCSFHLRTLVVTYTNHPFVQGLLRSERFLLCTACLNDWKRCEHDVRGIACPHVGFDNACGRDPAE